MAKVVVTAKIMPDSPTADLALIEKQVLEIIKKVAGEGEKRVTRENVAFGLQAINIIFVMDEKLGSPDQIEEDILKVPHVSSWQVMDARRAIG